MDGLSGSDRGEDATAIDAVVIGSGFGGMYMLHRLREMGLKVRCIESAKNVGGVWYWNRYPGARCDVMSIDYSYSFSDEIQQEWTWSERFAEGAEILRYANFVADKLALRPLIDFETRVDSLRFDDQRKLWIAETDTGSRLEATYCIMATGPLSVPKAVEFPGAETFSGKLYRSAKWPHEEVDFSGQRVAVIGTGSSGIQIVPVVAKQAQALTVFQRTPSFTLPMRNRPLGEDYVAQVKRNYEGLRASAKTTFGGSVRPVSSRPLFSVPADERQELMEEAWKRDGLTFLGSFSDLLTNAEANEIVADFVRDKISDVVTDPETAELLKPRGYPIFARRPCLDTGYYESFNRPNVSLIDCNAEPIEAITALGVKTSKAEYPFDAIILATGYDALTGAMLAIDVQGRGGFPLAEKWKDGARSYLGLIMAGFPNMFMLGGANGPCATANFIALNEQNADWVISCIEHMRRNHLETVEATSALEDGWMDEVNEIAGRSLMSRAKTWYTGSNIEGKPRGFSMYIGGFNRYREICEAVVAGGFRDLAFESDSATADADGRRLHTHDA